MAGISEGRQGAVGARVDEAHRVGMRGGPVTAIVPAIVLVAVLVWLSVVERATISGFWVGAWLALVVGLLLTTTPRAYAESIVRGLSDRTGAIIIAAFLFAGVFGKLLAGGGLVDGLLWLGLETGLQGASFTAVAFLLACLFAAGTGTSVGTVVAMAPVLYPAGVLLGADPTMLALAILAGGAFGDNIAPISDTTITSAFTQDAEMGDVVKNRLPLALSAAAIALLVFIAFGGGGELAGGGDAATAGATPPSPSGLVMLVPFLLVIGLAIGGQHIIVSLAWGCIAALAVGIGSGRLGPAQVFSTPAERGESTGLIEDGISGVGGAVFLVLFILALARLLADSGLMNRILQRLEARAAAGVKSAERTIVAVSLLFSIPLGANAPAILLVGPTLAKPLGRAQGLLPARVANLLDCSVCTVFYMLPWHNAVIVWFATVTLAASDHGLAAPSIASALLNPYAWALLAVLLFSVETGWNRKFSDTATREPVDDPGAVGSEAVSTTTGALTADRSGRRRDTKDEMTEPSAS